MTDWLRLLICRACGHRWRLNYTSFGEFERCTRCNSWRNPRMYVATEPQEIVFSRLGDPTKW